MATSVIMKAKEPNIFLNPNTDHTIESNRMAVLTTLLTDYFKPGLTRTATARYGGGYYFGYLFFGSESSLSMSILEFCHGLTERIIFWQTSNGTTWGKIWTI